MYNQNRDKLPLQVYQIHTKNSEVFEGSLAKITEKAIEMGIYSEELTFAYETMAKNKDIVAEFGINGCFLFSKKVA